MKLVSAAKLNLLLAVKGLRSDGFHEIETIFHPVGLRDELSLSARSDDTTEVLMEAAAALGGDLPSPDENLITRSIASLRGATGRRDGVTVAVSKKIPLAGGLAGGSGNAAATLIALDRLWQLELDTRDIEELGLALGSDVPYCLRGGTVAASGRGEILAPLPRFDAWFVLGISLTGLSTASVYGVWDGSHTAGPSRMIEMVDAIGRSDISAVGSLAANDLEQAVFALRPELAAGKEAMLEAGAAGALVSGSGPTIFGLCATRAEAQEVGRAVEGSFDRVEIVRSAERVVEFVGDSGGALV